MLIVAEVSANHNGSIETALDTIDAAVKAGADCVKFQTFDPDQMAVPYTIKNGAWQGYDLVDLYQKAQTPKEWHEKLFQYARERGIEPFSTPFHRDDVDFLERLYCPRYKIASFELTDIELIGYVAQTGKPIIMSTGMANKDEIQRAVSEAKKYNDDVTLLHCISEYPATVENTNLKTMQWLRRFNVKVGVSDHSLGSIVPVMATTLGASMIEKHFTITKDSLDADFSMCPEEFELMAGQCRQAQSALGMPTFGGDAELRRSLYYNKDLKKGHVVQSEDIKTARPALGLEPYKINKVIGSKLKQDVRENDPVQA